MPYTGEVNCDTVSYRSDLCFAVHTYSDSRLWYAPLFSCSRAAVFWVSTRKSVHSWLLVYSVYLSVLDMVQQPNMVVMYMYSWKQVTVQWHRPLPVWLSNQQRYKYMYHNCDTSRYFLLGKLCHRMRCQGTYGVYWFDVPCTSWPTSCYAWSTGHYDWPCVCMC